MAAKYAVSMNPNISTYGDISRVGSGAPAAAGASAKPTYLQRKCIGIMILAFTVVTIQWMKSEHVDNGTIGMQNEYTSISDDNGTSEMESEHIQMEMTIGMNANVGNDSNPIDDDNHKNHHDDTYHNHAT